MGICELSRNSHNSQFKGVFRGRQSAAFGVAGRGARLSFRPLPEPDDREARPESAQTATSCLKDSTPLALGKSLFALEKSAALAKR